MTESDTPAGAIRMATFLLGLVSAISSVAFVVVDSFSSAVMACGAGGVLLMIGATVWP